MVQIFGVNFPEQKLVKATLQSFYGIGPRVCQGIMAKLYIHPTARLGTLADKQVLDLTAELTTLKIDNDLKRQLHDNIRRLRDMGSYRGRRHAMNLPVRGQRTRTQISTARKLNRIERRG